MWNQLTKARSEYKSLGLESSLDYEKFAMISIVYNSTKIEGCSLDEGDTKLLLTEDLTAKGKPLTDHMMVKDHFEAFLYINEQAARKRVLSIDYVKEVNALVKKRTGGIEKNILGDFDSSKAHPPGQCPAPNLPATQMSYLEGELRTAPAYTDTRYFKNHEKIKPLLEQLCQKINDQLDSVSGNDCVALAADIHYHIVDIHPFADGNGRTARLFMNYIQLYHNEPLIKIFTEDRRDYLEALQQTDNTKDINIFRIFICEQQIKFFKHEIAKYKDMEADSGLTM